MSELALNTIPITEIIYNHVEGFITMLKNFIRSRYIQASMLFNTNAEENAEIEKIVNGIQCECSYDKNSIGLSIKYNNESAFSSVMENGQNGETLGGNNGMISTPSGGARKTKVPKSLWGLTTHIYDRSGIDIENEVNMMSEKLFSDIVSEAASSCGNEIAEAIKPLIIDMLNESLGGE